jgi:hypothetical protein
MIAVALLRSARPRRGIDDKGETIGKAAEGLGSMAIVIIVGRRGFMAAHR